MYCNQPGEELSGDVRLFLGIPLDSVGDRQSVQLKYRMGGLGNSLEEDVVAQVRVRQYRSSGGSDYETALDWRNVEGNGEQVLDIPVDSYRVAGKGRTYVEWRFAKRGGGSGVFVDKGIDLRNVRMEELKVGWYTKTVYSCEEEDNYRYGFNTQEKVNEVSGKGNHYTAPYWEYDPRTGRRWNLDPVDQVNISNYAAFADNPIWKFDWLGNTWKTKDDEKLVKKIDSRLEKREAQLTKKAEKLEAKSESLLKSNPALAAEKKAKAKEAREGASDLNSARGELKEMGEDATVFTFIDNGTEPAGRTSMNEAGEIEMRYGSPSQALHEAKHGFQHLNGDVKCIRGTGGALNVDIFDEVNSYRRQYFYNPNSVQEVMPTVKTSKDITPENVRNINYNNNGRPEYPYRDEKISDTPRP